MSEHVIKKIEDDTLESLICSC